MRFVFAGLFIICKPRGYILFMQIKSGDRFNVHLELVCFLFVWTFGENGQLPCFLFRTDIDWVSVLGESDEPCRLIVI